MRILKKKFFFILAPLIIIIDRLTKAVFTEKVCFFLFCIKPSINFGASFGIFSGLTILLVIIAVIVLLLILYFYFIADKKLNNLARTAMIFLFAGTLSNVLDRIFFGYILDWLTFSFVSFPAFNLADVSNTIGALLLVIFLLKRNKI